MPEVAVDALVAGLDTPSLRVLAGLAGARMDRAADLLDRALQELGCRPMVTLPPAREAALWAEATAVGAVEVLQGVGALWALFSRTKDAELRAALAEFFKDGQRWQRAIPEHRPAIEREILDHQRLLRAAGFNDITELDVTPAFAATAAAWLAETEPP